MSEVSESLYGNDGTARILVVDDEATTCNFCALALSQAGYSAIPITDPEIGLRILIEQGPFDLLLTDIQMPGRSGIELARIAREHDPTLAVIIMTGHTNVDTLQQSARQGVANFLSKPFEIEELRIAVGQALHKRDLMQEQVRLRALEQLLLSSETINGTLERSALCRVILECARNLIPTSAAFLYIAAADRSPELLLADPPNAALQPSSRSSLEQAVSASRPTFVPELRATVALQDVTGGLVAPLRAGGSYLGALLLCNVSNSARADTIDMAALLANQAGQALRNAHLYGELKRAYHDLAELDRMKSEFIAIASHELRSPLALVMGYTQMLRDRNEGQTRDYAQRAFEGAEKITQIVDNLTKLRDNDVRQVGLNREIVDLADLVQHVIERFHNDATARNHQVTLQRPDKSIAVSLDRDKVLLIVGNLLSNAIMFTPPGGIIDIAVATWSHADVLHSLQTVATNPSLRRIQESNTTTWAVIEVCDSGIGIPREHQSRIFERFYQIAQSLTREHGGVGLGLALVLTHVMQHEGLVWMTENQPHGSCFQIAFPWA